MPYLPSGITVFALNLHRRFSAKDMHFIKGRLFFCMCLLTKKGHRGHRFLVRGAGVGMFFSHPKVTSGEIDQQRSVQMRIASDHVLTNRPAYSARGVHTLDVMRNNEASAYAMTNVTLGYFADGHMFP